MSIRKRMAVGLPRGRGERHPVCGWSRTVEVVALRSSGTDGRDGDAGAGQGGANRLDVLALPRPELAVAAIAGPAIALAGVDGVHLVVVLGQPEADDAFTVQVGADVVLGGQAAGVGDGQ